MACRQSASRPRELRTTALAPLPPQPPQAAGLVSGLDSGADDQAFGGGRPALRHTGLPAVKLGLCPCHQEPDPCKLEAALGNPGMRSRAVLT